ncbi:MAG TPA: hypothetical protein DCO83_00185 [Mucilaginibacter sp.]|jgi:hypothetical protein|nr:hypothetical protein [Mucilaginibacter sp.]
MNKKNIETFNKSRPLFSGLKSYSVDEILAAGGTTAFANKMGKNPQNIIKRLEKLPKDAFLTDEEVETALKMLKESK